jgi:FPC/CPF motif-containing protein YcgG
VVRRTVELNNNETWEWRSYFFRHGKHEEEIDCPYDLEEQRVNMGGSTG